MGRWHCILWVCCRPKEQLREGQEGSDRWARCRLRLSERHALFCRGVLQERSTHHRT